jgi:Cys-tRNA(Pro)/Cys-tRNA(Cys) deacylase
MSRSAMLELKDFLAQVGVDAQLIDLQVPMKTAEAAAQQLGVPVGGIFKSLVFSTDAGEVLVAVLPGDKRVDFKAVARVAGCKKVSFASPEVALRETGYPPGGTPPLGYPKPLRVILDEALLQYAEGYGGGGRPELLLRIQPQELLRVTNGTLARVSL